MYGSDSAEFVAAGDLLISRQPRNQSADTAWVVVLGCVPYRIPQVQDVLKAVQGHATLLNNRERKKLKPMQEWADAAQERVQRARKKYESASDLVGLLSARAADRGVAVSARATSLLEKRKTILDEARADSLKLQDLYRSQRTSSQARSSRRSNIARSLFNPMEANGAIFLPVGSIPVTSDRERIKRTPEGTALIASKFKVLLEDEKAGAYIVEHFHKEKERGWTEARAYLASIHASWLIPLSIRSYMTRPKQFPDGFDNGFLMSAVDWRSFGRGSSEPQARLHKNAASTPRRGSVVVIKDIPLKRGRTWTGYFNQYRAGNVTSYLLTPLKGSTVGEVEAAYRAAVEALDIDMPTTIIKLSEVPYNELYNREVKPRVTSKKAKGAFFRMKKYSTAMGVDDWEPVDSLPDDAVWVELRTMQPIFRYRASTWRGQAFSIGRETKSYLGQNAVLSVPITPDLPGEIQKTFRSAFADVLGVKFPEHIYGVKKSKIKAGMDIPGTDVFDWWKGQLQEVVAKYGYQHLRNTFTQHRRSLVSAELEELQAAIPDGHLLEPWRDELILSSKRRTTIPEEIWASSVDGLRSWDSPTLGSPYRELQKEVNRRYPLLSTGHYRTVDGILYTGPHALSDVFVYVKWCDEAHAAAEALKVKEDVAFVASQATTATSGTES